MKNGLGVIFDMDGVLIDTKEFHRASWYEMAALEGLTMTDELFYGTFGMQNYQIMPMLAGPISTEEVTRLSDLKEEIYRRRIEGHLTVMPGVEVLLRDLQSSGFLLAIGTSTPRINLDFVLAQIPVRGFFDALVTGEDVKHSKPAPDTFLKASERLNLPPHKCVVVEDAVQGVQAGLTGGMRVIAVTTTRLRQDLHEADRIVDSLEEVNAQDFLDLLLKSPSS